MLRSVFLLFLLLPLTVASQRVAAQTTKLQPPTSRGITAPSPSPAAATTADKVATHSTWSFLSLEACGIETFLRAHQTYDGRGVIVLIFDTGVDPGIPGLLLTTEGGIKVIDVRDFSGTGDVIYKEVERAGDNLISGSGTVLHGLNTMKLKAWDGKYYYGSLNEKRFQNGLGDLNFNGSTNDVFGVLVFQDDPNHFVAYIDSDGDHDLSNEHPVSTYAEHHDTFAFHASDSLASSARRITGAVNFYPERNLVSLYFDDGSHGTHVAGIAAGHDIDNQKGFNGVAPGAEVIGVKFADNTAGGVTVSGSMQRAFQFAADLAKSQPKPVVVNMSFGIGSEIEGKSAMDKWLDSLLAATPNLTACVSAGNEGPGLSSVGLPGTAERVISSGAALPDDAARDLYNIYLTKPTLFDFSSRGGELAKPDIVSPGTAVSTVPDYVGGDRYNGTSMSSPYTTGCVALLLSAMKQEFPNYTPNAFEIKRAIMLSAVPLEGQTPLDQGFGMINIPAAYELLMRWHRKGYTPIHATVQTSIPSIVKTGTAAYYRAGNYPSNGDLAQFQIAMEDRPGLSLHDKALGMEAFDLVSDQPWMQPLQSSTYRRGEGGNVNISVRYNPLLLQKPGLYTGRIWAYPKGVQHAKSDSRFELLNTVIVPETFTATNYHVSVQDIKLAPGIIHREFFALPPGAKGLKFQLSTRDAAGGCGAGVFDNEGHELTGFGLRRGAARSASVFISGTKLKPGVFEVDLSRTMSSADEKDMLVDLSADATPLDLSAVHTSTDPNASASATLSNPTLKLVSLQPEGNIPGYERTIDTVIQSSDLFTYAFTPRPHERSATFDISIPAEDYNLFTDITCMVLKSDSSAVFNSAMDFKDKHVAISFDGADDSTANADKYLLYIRGGLALPDHEHPWRITIRERRFMENGIYMSSTPSSVALHPFQSQEVELRAGKDLPSLPPGYRFFGEMRLKQNDDNALVLPLEF